MNIYVDVVGQSLIPKADFNDSLVEGSQNFIKFVFNLDSDWSGLTVFAQFIQNGMGYNQYLDENNSVILPAEIITGKCFLVLYGSKNAIRATSNYLRFTLSKYQLIADPSSIEVTKSLYDQLVDVVEVNRSEAEVEIGELRDEFEQVKAEIFAAVGRPAPAATAAQMTDHDTIYVYVGSETGYLYGYWYYWDGIRFAPGAVYQATALQTDKTLRVENSAADAKAVGDVLTAEDVKRRLLENEIPNTTQRYTYQNGTVTRVQHFSGNVVVRTDTLQYLEDSIVETRTLSSGEQMVITIDRDTLETTVVYTTN